MIRPTLEEAKKELRAYADAEKAKALQRYFKTGPGQYAEGDVFIGIVVPHLRQVARRFGSLPLADIFRLVKSRIHEERLMGLLMLVSRFTQGDEAIRKKIFFGYLKHAPYINNWDLVDLSAPRIVGVYLKDKNRRALYDLAGSSLLWERRISILSTFAFIRQGDFEDALKLSESLLADEHDLIHKAVGWMLREVGKRDVLSLKSFLGRFYRIMPRTMLRYAIERFPEKERQGYLKGTK